jgi:two-component system, OmpR family, sensor kinase
VIRRSSVRWRLVAWVTGVLVLTSAAIFFVIYEQATSQLRSQIDADVTEDVTQLSQAMGAQAPHSPHALLTSIDRYVRAQPFTGTSTLLFAVIPGYGTVSNQPELFGASRPDDGETWAEQAQENREGHALVGGKLGLETRLVPDVGPARVDERLEKFGGLTARIGAGEPLTIVSRAQHSIARSFLIAGAVALVLALIASYLAGASVSLPLRRMARVATRVDGGDLQPRMEISESSSAEIRVLAESFNHMLDRLSQAFSTQKDFIADASHELRTPLTVIAGQLEVLAAQPNPEPEEIQRVQRLVAAEIARTSRLVDDMLLLSRSERSDFLVRQKVELPRFLTDLWTGVSIGVERRFELAEVPPIVLEADPDRLAQALRNLIGNAIEHTGPDDGLVRLEVALLPAGWVRFSVLDNGPGIDPAQRDRIFERFHRTDKSRTRATGGAGLGLAIVQAIAEAHGGRVSAGEAPSGGAKLELELPRARLERSLAMPQAAQESGRA